MSDHPQFPGLKLFGYDVVMIDPPWRFDIYSEAGVEKSPEAQYRTMTLDDIAALRVGDLLRAGGLVWAWFTWPLLIDAPRIFQGSWGPAGDQGWGLRVITGGAWAKRTRSGKLRVGPGYVVRTTCEPFAICSVGDRLTATQSPIARNFLEAVDDLALDGMAREHSRKPDEAYRLIEDVTPHAFRADVFSRETRDGWTTWGDENGKFNEDEGSGKKRNTRKDREPARPDERGRAGTLV